MVKCLRQPFWHLKIISTINLNVLKTCGFYFISKFVRDNVFHFAYSLKSHFICKSLCTTWKPTKSHPSYPLRHPSKRQVNFCHHSSHRRHKQGRAWCRTWTTGWKRSTASSWPAFVNTRLSFAKWLNSTSARALSRTSCAIHSCTISVKEPPTRWSALSSISP